MVTNEEGNTSCYKYDARGRKIAEWGTSLQPACFGYDDMDNMTTLRTFRADNEVITTDPSERTDGDVTTWAFNPVTGLEMSKTYADNTTVVKTYDAYNRLATVTDARGNVKTHAYEHARGLHLGTTYTVVDGTVATTNRSFTYNHLGQLTQLVDDAGTRCFGYNSYGERETDSLVVDGDTHLITEQRDSFGRSIGYVYSKNGSAQQTITTGFGDDGRIASVGFLHGGMAKNFGYTYLAGTNLLQVLTKPNGMTLTQTYEATRDLLTGMAYHRGSTLVAQRTYSYDLLGRPTARNTARQGSVVNDTFAHNTRSELVEATVSGKDYEYAYDNIGNREFSLEDGKATMYEANALNQYTAISENGAVAFVPQFDADGNQTLIKTNTGIWSAVYNAENRPVSFTNSDSNTVVECQYDSLGRRAYKKVTVNGSVTLHQRYIYREYLQIAALDLTRTAHPALWYITWDPSQPVATRPLAIQINGTWYTYGIDLTKNICELYSPSGAISTSYTYTPFGQVTASGSVTQPIQWSSELWDSELGLVYYNWRYYNSVIGRWIGRDFIKITMMRYNYLNNSPLYMCDIRGLYSDEANEALNFYRELIKEARDKGYNQAAYNLEYFLNVNPDRENTISMPLNWLETFSDFVEAVNANHDRMEADIKGAAKEMRSSTLYLGNYWDKLINVASNRLNLSELFYASGNSTLHTQYHISFTKKDCKITFQGEILHLWYDTYDWHVNSTAYIPGKGHVSDNLGLLLEEKGLGKSYEMKTKWREIVNGTYEIGFLWDSMETKIEKNGIHQYDIEKLKHNYLQETPYTW